MLTALGQGEEGLTAGGSVPVSLLGMCGWDPFFCVLDPPLLCVFVVFHFRCFHLRRGSTKINSPQDSVHIDLKS